MKALFLSRHGDSDSLQWGEQPDPTPGPGEVRVRMKAAALNHLDVWVRRGVEGHEFPLPLILGSDGAGVIDQLGPGVAGIAGIAAGNEIGAEVAIAPGFDPLPTDESLSGSPQLSRSFSILGETRAGTLADYAVVPAANVLPLPAGLSMDGAAALPLAALTAFHMLHGRARVQPGMDVLIQAAGSGVSVYAIQIAKAMGARVLAVSTKAQKLERARLLGASVLIDSTQISVPKHVRALTQGRGVDIAIDHVGEATFHDTLKCLARGGAVVTCGATSGAIVPIDLRLVFFKSLSILGSTMGGLGEMRQVWKMVSRGQIAPVIDRVIRPDEIASGHAALERAEVFGKVVVSFD